MFLMIAQCLISSIFLLFAIDEGQKHVCELSSLGCTMFNMIINALRHLHLFYDGKNAISIVRDFGHMFGKIKV